MSKPETKDGKIMHIMRIETKEEGKINKLNLVTYKARTIIESIIEFKRYRIVRAILDWILTSRI